MNHLFLYDNVVIGMLLLIVGFIFHWLGQLISALNWDFATKIGLQESRLNKEYKVYEHAIAVADSLMGWLYGIAAFGLIINAPWGYKLSWIPGSILLYHSLGYLFWTGNRNKDGNKLESDSFRYIWFLANLITGILTILIAWNAS